MLRVLKVLIFLFLLVVTACKRPYSNSGLQIVGGDEVQDDNDAVSQTTVALMDQNGPFCTGTIIHYEKTQSNKPGLLQILTAGHCLNHPEGKYATEVNIGKGYIPEALNADVVWLTHPKFNTDTMTSVGPGAATPVYDIALLVVRGDLNESQGRKYQAAKVGSPNQVKQGTRVIHAGYGMIETNDRASLGRLRKVGGQIENAYPQQKEWGTNSYGKGTCQGDSGGPSYLDEGLNETLTVLSATSRGGVPCSSGQGMYTDVTRFQGWMKCAFAFMKTPLTSLLDDDSGSGQNASDCQNLKIRNAKDPPVPQCKMVSGDFTAHRA